MNDFYTPRTTRVLDEAALVRLSRRVTIGWGVVQIAVALGAELLTRSVLDAGLSVLSLASGPVLGAFVLATSVPRVRGTAARLVNTKKAGRSRNAPARPNEAI